MNSSRILIGCCIFLSLLNYRAKAGDIVEIYTPESASCESCHGESISLPGFAGGRYELFSKADRGVGVIIKGELSNVTGNFGLLSDFHYFAPALHWPSNGDDTQQYGFGVEFIVATRGNVIKSVSDPRSELEEFDWEARDGSKGTLFSDKREESNTASDGTPYLAHSDLRSTWPLDAFGDPYWPGPFRIDIDPGSPTYGQPVTGEFTSDRDIIGIFDDQESDQGPIGIEVRHMTYSYARPYAEDFFFYDFWVRNNSSENPDVEASTYDSVYVAIMADTKEDFNNDDLIGVADMWEEDSHTLGDFFYEWDSDGLPQNTAGGDMTEWVGPVGYMGIGAIHTPNDMGVTDFHFFDDNYSPVTDAEFWPIISSNPGDPSIDSSLYFHGSDVRFDSDSLHGDFLDPDPTDPFRGADITYIFSTGPFSLAPGDSVRYSIVIVAGADSADLWENAKTAYTMAKELAYQGSSAPPAPHLSVVAADNQATLFWDGQRSETATDPRTGVVDFEGYKVYRSTDRGRSWGDPVTDHRGDVVGYVPIAQFDLIDSIMGADPLGYGYLGDETGLKHSFVDTDLYNGFEYWYCVTAYDRGDTASGEPSYENGIGNSTSEQHTVSVIPEFAPADITPGTVSGDTLSPVQGTSEATILVNTIDPFALTGHDYEITFNDSGDVVSIGEDTTIAQETTINVYDLTEGTYQFTNEATGEEFIFKNFPINGDNLPVVDGFRIYAENLEDFGIKSMGWTNVLGDESTFDWWTKNRTGNVSEFPEIVATTDDWKIVITEPGDEISVPITDGPAFSGTIAEYNDVPLRVYKVTDPDNPVDVSQYLQVIDLRVVFPESELLGPLGYDLIPGGKGYNPVAGDMWPDILRIRDNNGDWENEVWLRTQNGPSDAIPPSPGDEYTIETLKPFKRGVRYTFSTQAATGGNQDFTLDEVKVVPNPYIVSAIWEEDRFNKRLAFTHLPSSCVIDIYTLAGDFVVSLHHENSSGQAFWDLKNRDGQNVAYGLYIYVVKSDDGKKKIGKFLVIK
ncbi:MAG: hypothetical protein ACE5OP_09820 [Candidatus Glassbacteria bacterium]